MHVSNPAAREAFRHVNHISSVATATIAGAGAYGYELAVDAALHMLSGKT
ncbi:MAG: type II 3-dehydroquinate dehydratase [Pseudomonadota bacterium]